MDQAAAINIVKQYIAHLKKRKIGVQKAYIFGSYARGNFRQNSDIDLAVIMKNLTNSYLMQVQLMKIGKNFDCRIEPHPIDNKDFNVSNPFAKEILAHGIKIV